MTARLLEGRPYADAIRQELTAEAAAFQARNGHAATLAIIVHRPEGDDPTPRDVYARQLRRTARSLGMNTRQIELPFASTAVELHAALDRLNRDPGVQGIIVQLPLPAHIGRETLLDAIAPAKDVDGISAVNAGSLFLNLPARVPATCAAVMELLDRAGIDLDGRRTIVVGASPVVGRPLALMLLQRDATVTLCHIYTRDLPAFTRQADVLIACAGQPGLINGAMVRSGTVVVDVGINVLPDGQIVGDVDFAAVVEIAGAITPVPGGVGPLTNLMVMRQTLRALDV